MFHRVSTNLIKQISRRFPGDSRRDFKKNPGRFPCFGLLRRAEIPILWVFQLSPAK